MGIEVCRDLEGFGKCTARQTAFFATFPNTEVADHELLDAVHDATYRTTRGLSLLLSPRTDLTRKTVQRALLKDTVGTWDQQFQKKKKQSIKVTVPRTA